MDAYNITIIILFLILSYLVGSIPFGVILGKLIVKKDIREYGSKNIGSTNAIRVLGKKVGFLVFFCDVLKGALVIILIKILSSTNVWHNPEEMELFFYGIPAIIGHCYSIFLDFKGGKAVATSLGVVLVIIPIPAILCLVIFAIVLFTTGYVSLASTGATITVVSTCWILYAFGVPYDGGFWQYFISKPSLTVAILFSVLSLLIIFKHSKNYKRLINGTENCFKKKKIT